jgi:hypothetical protein
MSRTSFQTLPSVAALELLCRLVRPASTILFCTLLACRQEEVPTVTRVKPLAPRENYSAKAIYAAALKYERDAKYAEAVLLLTCVAERFPTHDPGLRAAERLPQLMRQTSSHVVNDSVRETRYCQRCGGSGHVRERCPACGGSGTYSSDNPGNCFRCRGSGTIDVSCDLCAGSGKVTVPRSVSRSVIRTIDNSIAAHRAYFVSHYPNAGLAGSSGQMDEATRMIASCLPREIRQAIDDEPRRRRAEDARKAERRATRERAASALRRFYPQTSWDPDGVSVGSGANAKIEDCRIEVVHEDYAIGIDPQATVPYATATFTVEAGDLSETETSPNGANFIEFKTRGGRDGVRFEYRYHGGEAGQAYTETERRNAIILGQYRRDRKAEIAGLLREIIRSCSETP